MEINMWMFFDNELKNIFMNSMNYWKSKKIRKLSIEHILHTMLKMNCKNVINTFNNFNIDINKIIDDIDKGIFMKGFNDDNKLIRFNKDMSFDGSIPDSVESASIFINKNNGGMDVEKLTVDHLFLAMCITSSSKVYSFFNEKGISSDVIQEYMLGLDNTTLYDNFDDIIKDMSNVVGKGGSDDGIDTLERPDPNNPENNNNKKNKNTINITKIKSGSNKTPILDQFSSDLTELASKGKIGNIIGREKEIDILMEILCKKNKKNAILLGDPGVGKSAVIEGLAVEINKGNVPLPLKGKRLLQLDQNALVSGTRYRGDFEERMKYIVEEMTKSDNVIIFIDEIHTILGAGNMAGGMDMGNVLKPGLARGDFQIIGATTNDEYQKYVLNDGALERRFQTLEIHEPTIEESELILQGLKKSFENYHNIKIDNSAINAAVRFSTQYMPSRFRPDKCIDILDSTGARTKMRTKHVPDNIEKLREQLIQIRNKKDDAARKKDTNKAAEYYKKEIELQSKLEEKENNYYNSIIDDIVTITENDVADVISRLTDIPASKLTDDQSKRLLQLEDIIKKKLVGQDKAVASVCKCIRRAKTDLHEKHKPLGSFMFMGPTGVGKTELARLLATEIFGKESNLLKFDMAEYNEKFDISKLIGTSAGFVGYEDGGKLTEAVRKTPYSVVLFDELEKAHKDVYNILLSLLEDGYVVDGRGRKVYFNNTIIIMTSNIGATEAYNSKQAMGFGEESFESNNERITKIMKKELELQFSPEFLNRLDEIIVFNQLDHESIKIIVDLAIEKLNKRIAHKDIIVTITDNMREHIIEKGYDKKFGARPINRTIQNMIEDIMAEKLLRKEIVNGMTLEFDYDKVNDKINYTIIENRNNTQNNNINEEKEFVYDENIDYMQMFRKMNGIV